MRHTSYWDQPLCEGCGREHQPRERHVACVKCGRPTIELEAECREHWK